MRPDPSYVPDARREYLVQLNNLRLRSISQDASTEQTNITRYLSYQELSRLIVRYELYRKILEIPGEIVEFGVFLGSGLVNFLQLVELHEPHNWQRMVVGFDTFSGLSGATERDGFLADGDYLYSDFPHLQEILSLNQDNKLKRDRQAFMLVRGDVRESLPKFLSQNPSFLPALVWLDLDLYEPTLAVISHLTPLLRTGCILAFDELNHREFPGETLAYLESGIKTLGPLRRLTHSKVSYIQVR